MQFYTPGISPRVYQTRHTYKIRKGTSKPYHLILYAAKMMFMMKHIKMRTLQMILSILFVIYLNCAPNPLIKRPPSHASGTPMHHRAKKVAWLFVLEIDIEHKMKPTTRETMNRITRIHPGIHLHGESLVIAFAAAF